MIFSFMFLFFLAMQFFLKWCSVIKEDTSWYVRKVWGEEKHCRTLWLGLRVSVSLCHWLLLKGFLRVLFFPFRWKSSGCAMSSFTSLSGRRVCNFIFSFLRNHFGYAKICDTQALKNSFFSSRLYFEEQNTHSSQ